MNQTLRYCPQCFNQLRQWGELACCVYEHVCEFYATQDGSLTLPVDQFVTISDNFMQIVRFLESKGYLVSTEALDDIHIAIKPSEYEWDGEDFWYFCADFANHA